MLVSDVFGKPCTIVRADFKRDLYQQGQSTISYVHASIFLACGMMGAVAMLMVDRLSSRMRPATTLIWDYPIPRTGMGNAGSQGVQPDSHQAR